MYTHKNLEELFEQIGKMPGQKVVHGEHFDYIKTTHSIWPYQLFNLQAPLEILDDTLTKIEVQVNQGEIPQLLMCDPNTDVPETIERLTERNYSKGSWMAMSYDLSLQPELNTHTDFQIELIKEEKLLDQWIAIAEKELMGGEKLNIELFTELLRAENCSFFLGRLNGVPIATSLLYKGSDSGGIYLVATSSDHRRQGFGAKMTNIALKKAKELGLKKVDIQATHAGRPLYATLGFQEHGEIHLFKIKKNPD